jgi:ParB family chromosome partitioning protein
MVVMIPTNMLKQGEDKFRKLTHKEYEMLKNSISEHGILHPLIVRKDGSHYIILSGNHRWLVAKELGIKEVPCIVIENDKIAELGAIFDTNICTRTLTNEEKEKFKRIKEEEKNRIIEQLPKHIKNLINKLGVNTVFQIASYESEIAKIYTNNQTVKTLLKEKEQIEKELKEIKEKYNTLKRRTQEKIQAAVQETVYSDSKVEELQSEIEERYRENIETLNKQKIALEQKLEEVQTKLKQQQKDSQLLIQKLQAEQATLSNILKHTVSVDAVVTILDGIIKHLESANNSLLLIPENTLNNNKNEIFSRISKIQEMISEIEKTLHARKKKAVV